jgi:hypothetical protein
VTNTAADRISCNLAGISKHIYMVLKTPVLHIYAELLAKIISAITPTDIQYFLVTFKLFRVLGRQNSKPFFTLLSFIVA